ncbi:MAG TPA: DUF4340 domain-containing protein [Verrucomicrobiae bacterium]|nr:DUF4340 domain-containing protein [Verrucomicrobiae bacterium]
MSPKKTWFWLLVAAGLFAFIFVFRPHRAAPAGPARILPQLKPDAVTSIQVRPPGPGQLLAGAHTNELVQLQLVAERTNGSWQLLEPMVYPAAGAKIQHLLGRLAELTPATYITPEEVRSRADADTQYGFTTPQASIIISQGDYRAHLLVGATTPPGDQVFLQVVSHQGVYVVDADLLKLLPRTANDWRDTSAVPPNLVFDRLSVTNRVKEAGIAGVTFTVQREGTNGLWRLVWPFTRGARADNLRIQSALSELLSLQVRQFCSDTPTPDLESFGLARPELEVGLAQGTNTLALLQVGRSPTNDANVVYARRLGQNAIFTVPKQPLEAWQRSSLNDFRDPHLLTVTEPVARIQVHGRDDFSVELQTNGNWRIQPENLPADPFAVSHFLFVLTNVPIIQFSKDVVNDPDLPEFGLAAPIREYRLFGGPANAIATNNLLVDLRFGLGTNQEVYARRTDESCVYAISTNEFARLPDLSWTLRAHQLFAFTETDLAGVTLRQQGRERRLLRRGPHQWSLAPGSQGIINDLAVEETVRGLTQAAAVAWVGRGDAELTRFGFRPDGYQITFDLLNGQKTNLEFGGLAPSGAPYAAVMFEGQRWICEFPPDLFGQVAYSLSVP